jgi:hypothetical protein
MKTTLFGTPLLDCEKPARPMPTDYTPYHTFPEFNHGIDDYMEGRFSNPYDGNPRQGVAAQAWDRGSEYAMRVIRHSNI